ncbi:hydrophobic surface binding protein A-domain-containing protein [Aspergillus navahoensis]
MMWLPTAWLLLASVTPIVATPTPDGSTSTLLTSLSARLVNLDGAIASYTGGDASHIQSASNAIIISIDRGLHDIQDGPDLTLATTKAVSLQFTNLTKTVEAAVHKLSDKKSLFEGACAGTMIQKILRTQRAVNEKLVTLVATKAPQSESDSIRRLGQSLLAALESGVGAYEVVADICSQVTPAAEARIELRSLGNVTSSSGTSTTTQSPASGSPTASSPVFTGAAGRVAQDLTGPAAILVGLAAVIGF